MLFSGTASDPYSGTQGSDIQNIWIDIEGQMTIPQDFQYKELLLGHMIGISLICLLGNTHSRFGLVILTSALVILMDAVMRREQST